MALKTTIYKMNINLSNLDTDVYETFALTVALHPSENLERMVSRVLAYCLNSQEFISFTKGLSEANDPDIWAKNYSDEFLLWIDVGEPAFDRIKKASRLARQCKVYSFNTKSDVWWKQSQADFSRLNVSVYQFEFAQIQQLAQFVSRSMNFSITVTDNILYVATEEGNCEINLHTLQNKE